MEMVIYITFYWYRNSIFIYNDKWINIQNNMTKHKRKKKSNYTAFWVIGIFILLGGLIYYGGTTGWFANITNTFVTNTNPSTIIQQPISPTQPNIPIAPTVPNSPIKTCAQKAADVNGFFQELVLKMKFLIL